MYRMFTAALLLALSVTSATAVAESSVSRSEALLLIFNSVGQNVAKVSESPFVDAGATEWFTPYMIKGVHVGAISPDATTGLIYPHKPVSRAEFCKILSIAYGLPTNSAYGYVDVPSTAWYTKYIGITETYDLFATKGSTHVFPEKMVTPNEAVTAITKLKKQNSDLRVSKKPTALEIVQQKMQDLQTTTRLLRNTPFISELQAVPPSTTLQAGDTVRSGGIKQAVLAIFGKQTNIADATKIELLAAVNKERSQHNLPALLYNHTLEKAAQAFAHDMWQRGYFSHFTPEGESFLDRIRSAGYMTKSREQCGCFVTTCTCEPKFSVGENIAKGQYTVEHVVREWMQSPGHRKNILQTQYGEVGFGVYNTVWVQNFGRVEFLPIQKEEAVSTLELVE